MPQRSSCRTMATLRAEKTMPLRAGEKLGNYEILSAIGAGGMGEVYRARDTKLEREVAIKVLPEELSKDPERLARFEREAKLLASLNHPAIATLHGFEDGFLVMELVEGETLAGRIARGPVSVDEALPLFIQIAEGLEAAHQKGVIHRDLKPANIKITPEGKVKILDFGLAKAFAPAESEVDDSSQSPTLTKGTALGAIMGTASYMSPEQARGNPVDKRTDIWAYGVCFFETLSGRRPFDGETVTDTISAVVRAEPAFERLPGNTPPTIRKLLQRCLMKDRRSRLRDIGDALVELGDAESEPVVLSTAHRRRFVGWLPWGLAAGLAMALLWSLGADDDATPGRKSELSIELPATSPLWTRSDIPSLVLTPDGRSLVFLGGGGEDRQIFVRSMADRTVRPIPGTERAEEVSLFVSPDGEWVGFYRDETLWKTRIDGGIPVAILKSRQKVWSARWFEDDTIVYTVGFSSPLHRVSADGGKAETLTDQAKGEIMHWSPRMLPDGKTVLFSVSVGNLEATHIELLSLETRNRKKLLEDSFFVEYARSGHLIFGRGETLFAVPFDVDRLEVTGSVTPVVNDVLMDQQEHRGALFTMSNSGTLVYAPRSEGSRNRLVWASRTGDLENLELEPGQYRGIRISPDGSKVLVRTWDGREIRLHLLDLRRNVASPLNTGGDSSSYPVWSPDGSRLAFQSNRAGPYNMFSMWVDGRSTPEPLFEADIIQTPSSWSPDGKFLAFVDLTAGEERSDVLLLPMGSPGGEPQSLFSSESSAHSPRFSPNGRFIAYVSDESGRPEIYVAEFAPDGAQIKRTEKVSQSGGWEPVWSRDGRELYFRNLEGSELLFVDVQAGTALAFGEPKKLLDTPRLPPPIWWGAFYYDVAPDGRFLMVLESEERNSPMNLVVVLNWFEELERLVPTN